MQHQTQEKEMTIDEEWVAYVRSYYKSTSYAPSIDTFSCEHPSSSVKSTANTTNNTNNTNNDMQKNINVLLKNTGKMSVNTHDGHNTMEKKNDEQINLNKNKNDTKTLPNINHDMNEEIRSVGLSDLNLMQSSTSSSNIPIPSPLVFTPAFDLAVMNPDECPECDELYISTKTKVLYFNCPIDIHSIFWKIPIVEYWNPIEGVIKKQIKIVSKSREEFETYRTLLEQETFYREHIIKQIDNPSARVLKYKDERKITIGISKKDIMNMRGKIKNAFYNCFVIIIRFYYMNSFREIHVKVFNTGKMEIPGVFNKDQLDIIKEKLLSILAKYIDTDVLNITESESDENVLINSNFNCGFYINREKLFQILTQKYGIETAYDPCSYPGVKCKYYFNNEIEFDETLQTGQIKNEDRNMKMVELGENKKYTEVSFMIFRTGSCLIVGNSSERKLRFIFDFLKGVLQREFMDIRIENERMAEKDKTPKKRKKVIEVSEQFFKKKIARSSL